MIYDIQAIQRSYLSISLQIWLQYSLLINRKNWLHLVITGIYDIEYGMYDYIQMTITGK